MRKKLLVGASVGIVCFLLSRLMLAFVDSIPGDYLEDRGFGFVWWVLRPLLMFLMMGEWLNIVLWNGNPDLFLGEYWMSPFGLYGVFSLVGWISLGLLGGWLLSPLKEARKYTNLRLIIDLLLSGTR